MVGVTLFLSLFFLPPIPPEKLVRTTPEGAVYDVRTHQYRDGKVHLRPELGGLRGEDKREIYDLLGLTINAGSAKWLEAQERWKSELDRRHALRVQIAQEYAQKRRERLQRPPVIIYQRYYVPYFRNVFYGNYFWDN